MSATTWKARWEMVDVAERPNAFDDTIQEINPVLYHNMYTTVRGGSRIVGRGVSVSRSHMSFYFPPGGGIWMDACVILRTEELLLAALLQS